MQNHHFNAEVFILPLDNYYLILGAQWLETLGEITWNFKKLKMKFQLGHRTCVLRGERFGKLQLINDKKLHILMHKQHQLAFMQLVMA